MIANRHLARAQELAANFSGPVPVTGIALEAARGPFDLVLNATSASLGGKVPALPADAVGPAAFCYDLAYGSGPTAFMQWARELGAAGVADGIGMLVEQGAESFELWRGVRPPTAPVLAELRQRVASR